MENNRPVRLEIIFENLPPSDQQYNPLMFKDPETGILRFIGYLGRIGKDND